MKRDPFIAELLDRLTESLNDEFRQRIEAIEFKTDYPKRLLEGIGLVEVLRINLLNKKRLSHKLQ